LPRTAIKGGAEAVRRRSARAHAVRRLDLPLDFRDGRDADRTARLAARDQSRQSRECRTGAPMAAKKNLKCSGSDIFAAQEPQPVEALAVVEGAKRFRSKRNVLHQLFPIRGSVPAASRVILARCLAHKRIAIRPNVTAAPVWPMAARTMGVSALAARAAAEE